MRASASGALSARSPALRPGGTFFEPLGIIRTLPENVSDTESAQVLAIFVHEEGATLTTYLE